MIFFRIITLSYLFCLYGALGRDDSSDLKMSVGYVQGEAYLQRKLDPIPPPSILYSGSEINDPLPIVLISSKDSYLEVFLNATEKSSQVIRVGRRTALEFFGMNRLFFIQGSALFSHRNPIFWSLDSNVSSCFIEGSGTWLLEKTILGFKVIVLEGELKIGMNEEKRIIKPGELVLTLGKEGQISQTIQIELPLLLGTSRLLNNFPNELDSHSRLISAAQVQAIRMKKKFQAFVGGVSPDNKLRIWAFQKNTDDE